MKTRLSHIFLALAVLLTAASCKKDPEFLGTSELEGGGVVLNFVCSDPQTKTTMNGDDAFHENTITTIDYFLYPEGQTGSNAYLHDRVVMNGRTSYNVLVNTSQLSALFSGAAAGNKCDVFAIANYPSTITGATDVSTLRNLALSTNFSMADTLANFVMCGQAQAKVINKNKTKAAEGTVTLTRAASKITFECKVAPSVTIINKTTSGDEVIEQEITWVPLLDQMGAYLVNSFSDGKVSGEEVAMDEGSLRRYTERPLTDSDSDDWYTCAPFYSYAQSWNDGDEREPFIKLVVPWAYLNQQGQQAGQKQFYYKVPCPGLSMEGNTWYHIKLDVAILGGDDFEAMLNVEGEYYVLDWNTQTIVQADAEIKDARYISVPSNTYNMYNTDKLDVLITSSHDAVLSLKSVRYQAFVSGAKTDYTTDARNGNWITYDDETRTFTINHPLNNDVSTSSFDSSPYVFTFEITHADDATYSTGNIVVTQYPAMYIDELQSNKYAFINGRGNEQATSVNVSDDNNNSLANLASRNSVNDSGNNTNSHMYRVHVTAVYGTDYVIGDPRLWSTNIVTTLNNLGNNYMATGNENENMIAPEFMVASSVGAFSIQTPLSYQMCATRCAAYQESGYPAGRWRIPTKAEILFLITLSSQSKIPQLFAPDTDKSKGGYWCSSGVIYPLNNGTIEYLPFAQAASYNNNENWARCIYDSWDWGDDPDSSHMTSWGGYQTH